MMTMLLQVGPGDDYVLTVGGFNDVKSTLGNSLSGQTIPGRGNLKGMKFSTK